jgi:trigger factor
MSVQVEETGPVERRLRIDIPTAEVDAAFDSVYRELARTTRVRGFRPGRAPRSVLERMLGERARAEVVERLVHESLPRAVNEADLAVVGEPRLRPEAEPKQGTPFVYEATVEIRPPIELRKVRGLEIERPVLPEPEEDPIDHYLEELRGSQAQLVAEPEGTLAARGHVAVLDYEGTCDGRPFEGGSGKEVALELGASRAVPGFEEHIEGMSVGTEREFDVEIPETYPGREVAGKQAHFNVRLVELKRKELPDLDDELAKDVSDFDSLEALREDLRAKVTASRDREMARLLRETVAKKLVEENPFPVPPSLVERQLSSRLAQAVGALGREVPVDQVREAVEKWREEWRPQAEDQVRLALLVPDVAKAESIEVTDEDVETALREIAQARNVKVTQLRREYRERGVLDGLRASVLEERVLEFLVAEATVSEV